MYQKKHTFYIDMTFPIRRNIRTHHPAHLQLQGHPIGAIKPNLYFCITKNFCSEKTNQQTMSFLRVLLAILFPPLSVIDQGCGSVLIVLILTLCGWVPGVLAALIILNKN